MRLRLQEQLEGLERVVALGHSLDHTQLDEALAPARELLERAGQRQRLAPGACVVALLGTTGSGKSSLFNALVGTDAARSSARRPTTTAPLAAVPPGDLGLTELLDWLKVDRRVEVTGAGLGPRTVLLDLPDIDSDEPGHRRTAARLAGLVDVLVWVLDPQKYADAVVHHDFLVPMAAHAEVTCLVLNQVDLLSSQEQEDVLSHLRCLLDDEGLEAVSPVALSARTGQGVARLRETICQVAAQQEAVTARLDADVRTTARSLAHELGTDTIQDDRDADRDDGVHLGRSRLEETAARASGVETVTWAVGRARAAEAASHVGWLPLRWLGRLRKDPLRALHLGAGRSLTQGETGSGPDEVTGRSSLPPIDPATAAELRTQARTVTDLACRSLPEQARSAVIAHSDDRAQRLGAALDLAVSSTPLGVGPAPRWWRLASGVQWLAALTALGGGAWLAATHLARWLLLVDLQPPRWGIVPWPAVVLVGGVVLGLAAAAAGRSLARLGARRVQRRAARRLREASDAVVRRDLLQPLQAEVRQWEELSRLLAQLSSSRR
ncbi:GTPase [Actinomyces faecalis]|uniref:GTPase n=1 Tax=Actinomyces faecalis TaxID=2722820 RepID=UPI001557E78B|nr:GTPase [Actinomyces faecalis]